MTDGGDRPFPPARQAYTPSFSPDGGRLALVADLTGRQQAWLLDEPGAWPAQVTATREGTDFAVWSPTRAVLAVGYREDGRENTQLALYRPSDGRWTDVGTTPGATHWWGGWSNAGDAFAFSADAADGATFDVYVQGVGDDDPERVYESDGWYSVVEWCPDDGGLVLSEQRARAGTDLHVLDLATGECEQVTPEDEAAYRNVNWGPDGAALYLTTDRGRDTRHVARLDPETRSVEPVLRDDRWGVDGINVHPGTGTCVYALNVDGYSAVETGRLSGTTVEDDHPAPDLPKGVMGEATFAPSGERLALTVSSRRSGTNVYVVDVPTGRATRWTGCGGGGPEELWAEPTVIRYESADGREIPALFTAPVRDAPAPAVVDLHGGPERQRRPAFRVAVRYLLDAGYAVMEPNVRGSTGYGTTYAGLDDGEGRFDALADVRAAAEWLRERPAVDGSRLAALGSSYGGLLALLSAAAHGDHWAAAVEIAGITDLVAFVEETAGWGRAVREAEFGSVEDDRELLESLSPIHRVEELSVPVLAVHGEEDTRVSADGTHRFVERARECGVDVELVTLAGEGHQLAAERSKAAVWSRVVEFLDERV